MLHVICFGRIFFSYGYFILLLQYLSLDDWRSTWPWIQASIVISTVAVVVAVCVIVLVAKSWSSQACSSCERYYNIVLVAVSLCMATGIWIGSAISYSQTNGSSSSQGLTSSQYVYDQTNGWLIGTIVLGLFEMVMVDLVVLILNVLSMTKDSGNDINKIVNIGSSVLRFLLYATVLTWTIVIGEKYKENYNADYWSTAYWTWQIFLITGACALVVAVVLFVLLWCCCDKCSEKGDGDNFCPVCTLIATTCRCQQRPRRASAQVGAVTDDAPKKVSNSRTATNEQNRPASGRRSSQSRPDSIQPAAYGGLTPLPRPLPLNTGNTRPETAAGRRNSKPQIVLIQPNVNVVTTSQPPRQLPVATGNSRPETAGHSPVRRSSQPAINQEGLTGATKTHTVTFPMAPESPTRPRLEPISGQTSPKKKRKNKKHDQQVQDGAQGDDAGVANETDKQRKEKKKKHRHKQSPEDSHKNTTTQNDA